MAIWEKLFGARKKSDPQASLVREDGTTPLMDACNAGDLAVAVHLLESGANPNIRARVGWTALMSAVKKGHPKIVQRLLASGADPNSADNSGANPLMLATLGGHEEIALALLSAGARVDAAEQKGKRTALLIAADLGRARIARALLQKGASHTATNASGWSPLMLASYEGHVETVRELLKGRADPNAREPSYGATALFFAAQRGHTAVVEALLKQGADPNLKDNAGVSASAVATKADHKDIAALLLAASAGVGSTHDDPVMSEEEALTNGTLNVITYLGAGDIQVIDSNGNIIPPAESDGEIIGIWVREFPSNTTKKAFLYCFCSLHKMSNPSSTDAPQLAIVRGQYQIAKNTEKGGFDVRFI